MRFLALLALAFLASPVAAQPKPLPADLVAPTDALSPADERKAFTLPPGFDAQLVASEPDIQKPMQMAWDAKGRLWVTTSYHYPFAAPLGKGTDKLFVLSDFDPATGKAKTVKVFASDLNIPIGILPLPDCKSVIVSSVGEIRKYTIAEGELKADKMEVLFSGFGYRDTHGMYNSYTLMPDGWVYSCHGFNNDSTVKGKDGHEVKMQSGNTFRFRPDGSRIEVYSRGQVNPFGMTVDPWFNLYTADCHSKPITQVIPGAYYESFGKPHDGLGYGPVMFGYDPGGTGMCGVAWYDADHFPKEHKGSIYLGNVVTNRVHRSKIEWHGATPKAIQQPDLIASTDRWFRPVDIKLGPDGAIYVADFYNKIIGHYEVDLKHPARDKDHGRIWRVVYKGTGNDGTIPAPKFAYSDLTTEKPEAVDKLLGNPNIMVRLQATNELIHRKEGEKAAEGTSELYAVHRMWVDAARAWRGGGAGQPKQAEYGNDKPLLAAHQFLVVRAREEWEREHPRADRLNRALPDLTKADAHVRSAALEEMAEFPKAEYVPVVLDVLKSCAADDSHLKQAARVTLRNCLRDGKAWPNEYDANYADMALAIPNENAADYLLLQASNQAIPPQQLAIVAEHVARNTNRFETVPAWQALSSDKYSAVVGDAILGVFRGAQARGKQLDKSFAVGIVDKELNRKVGDEPLHPDNIRRLTSVCRVLVALPAETKTAPETKTTLTSFVNEKKTPLDLRVAAAEALLRVAPEEGFPTLRKLIADASVPADFRDRLLLAFAVSGNKEARLDARDALRDAPYRTAVAVGLALASTPTGAEDLLNAVKIGKAPARLLQEKAILERLKGANIPDLDKQIAALTKGLPAPDLRLADLIKRRSTVFALAKPDKEAGAKLFVKYCAACHKIGEMGGKIAPQLDGIGLRGVERLLEDTLDPNRNVDQAFRARVITTKDEKTITGLMLRVEGEVLIVADGEGKEIRIPTKDIEANRETMLSPMPANFGDVIPEADFVNLVAYLLDQKIPVAKKE